jgi:hypothetical protein
MNVYYIRLNTIKHKFLLTIKEKEFCELAVSLTHLNLSSQIKKECKGIKKASFGIKDEKKQKKSKRIRREDMS